MCAPVAPLWPLCPAVVQLKLSHASLEVQKQLAEQQYEEALATVSVLEGQLADIGAEIATHMQVGLVVLHSPAWGPCLDDRVACCWLNSFTGSQQAI